LEDVKQFIEVRSDNAEFDLKLLTLARTATRQLERYTRSEFIYGARTVVFNTRRLVKNNGEVLPQLRRLTARPVDLGEAFTVNYDPDRVFAAATLLPTKDYFHDNRKNRLFITASGTVRQT